MDSTPARQQLIQGSEWPTTQTRSFVALAVLQLAGASFISLSAFPRSRPLKLTCASSTADTGFVATEEQPVRRVLRRGAEESGWKWKCGQEGCGWALEVEVEHEGSGINVYTVDTPRRHGHRLHLDDPTFKAWAQKQETRLDQLKTRLTKDAHESLRRWKTRADSEAVRANDVGSKGKQKVVDTLAPPQIEQAYIIYDLGLATTEEKARKVEEEARTKGVLVTGYPVRPVLILSPILH